MANPVSAYPDIHILQGASTLSCSTVDIGATSSLLLAANDTRASVTLKNTHATQTIFIAGANPATSANGFALAPASAQLITLETTSALYAIASGATTPIEIIEISA